MAQQNHKVGEFTMKFKPRQGMVLMVTFEIDTNGLLTVSAKDPVTNKSANITITSDKLNLTDSEVKEMAKFAKKQREGYNRFDAAAIQESQK